MRVSVTVYSEASLALMFEKVLVALAVLSSKILEEKPSAIAPAPCCVCSCRVDPREEELQVPLTSGSSWQVLAAFTLGQFSIGGLWMFCGCRRPRSTSVSGVSVKPPRRRGGGILDGDRE